MREANKECDDLKERAKEEESLVTLDELKQIHSQAKETVLKEKEELTEDRDQFSGSVDMIGELSL